MKFSKFEGGSWSRFRFDSRRISWGMLHFLSHCTCVSSFFFNLLASFGVIVFLSFNQGGQWGLPGGPGGQAQKQGGHGPPGPPAGYGPDFSWICFLHGMVLVLTTYDFASWHNGVSKWRHCFERNGNCIYTLTRSGIILRHPRYFANRKRPRGHHPPGFLPSRPNFLKIFFIGMFSGSRNPTVIMKKFYLYCMTLKIKVKHHFAWPFLSPVANMIQSRSWCWF